MKSEVHMESVHITTEHSYTKRGILQQKYCS